MPRYLVEKGDRQGAALTEDRDSLLGQGEGGDPDLAQVFSGLILRAPLYFGTVARFILWFSVTPALGRQKRVWSACPAGEKEEKDARRSAQGIVGLHQ